MPEIVQWMSQGTEYYWDVLDTDQETTLFERPLDPNNAGNYRASVLCKRISDGAVKTFIIECGFKDNAGTAELFNLAIDARATTDASALSDVTATLDVANGNVRVRVTGQDEPMAWSVALGGENMIYVEIP